MQAASPPGETKRASGRLARVVVRGVVKTYGSTSVLRGVSFELHAGSVFVLTGQNGAGKSTLLSILSGQRRATKGEVHYLTPSGAILPGREARTCMGWVSHQPLAYLELSAAENLALVAELHGAAPGAVEKTIERLGMTAFARKPLSALSRGQTQRVALGRALVHEPDFLLLDEPWTGLDLNGARFLEEILREQAARGAIVFIVSHQRDVIEKLEATEIELCKGLAKTISV